VEREAVRAGRSSIYSSCARDRGNVEKQRGKTVAAVGAPTLLFPLRSELDSDEVFLGTMSH
jgi:hypothetical protein